MPHYLLQRLIPTILLSAMITLSVAGQEMAGKGLLSGVWVPEKPKNSPKNYKLTITHDSDLVTIFEEFEFEKQGIENQLKLFPNGRGERNLVTFGGADAPSEIASKTRWKEGKLIRNYVHCYTTIIRTDSVSICSESVETYSISTDGQELTVYKRRTRYDSGPPILDKRQFRKAS